jgi:hypothetical protein
LEAQRGERTLLFPMKREENLTRLLAGMFIFIHRSSLVFIAPLLRHLSDDVTVSLFLYLLSLSFG